MLFFCFIQLFEKLKNIPKLTTRKYHLFKEISHDFDGHIKVLSFGVIRFINMYQKKYNPMMLHISNTFLILLKI